MERPIPMPIGTLLNHLDTPSLYIDEEIFIDNCRRFEAEFSKYDLVLRPDVSLYRSADLARFHLAQFPGVNSVHTNTLSEASNLTSRGLDDILVGTPFAFDSRLEILADVSKKAKVSVSLMSISNMEQLSKFGQQKDFEPRVTIPLVADSATLGIYDYEKARDLAMSVDKTIGIELEGFTLSIPKNFPEETLHNKLRDVENILVELGSKGITVKKISVFTSDFAVMKHLKFSIKTEIIDSYGIFETRDFQMSPVGVITSVMSHPQSDMVYLDCGQKSISIDQGMPKPIDLQKSSVSQMSAEHGYLQIRDANWLPKLGDRVGLSPSDVSDTFNLYNYLNIISNGILKAIYEIDGRGYYV